MTGEVTSQGARPGTDPHLRRLALGVGLGSILEYYDFFIAIFGATIVWPTVFFSWAKDPALAYSLSLASFGVLYFVRPIGAYLFGQYGDRRGRRSMMLLSLSIMGLGVLGVGLDPGYDSFGISSVVLLFLFRVLFGLGLGGEFGGASAWLVEAARNSKRRGFWAMWAAPSQIGYAIASFSFTIVATLTGKQFLTVGWRIPFLIGGVLLVIGLVVRYSLRESPLFEQFRAANSLEAHPARLAIAQHWKEILLLSGVLLFVLLPAGAVQASYGIPFLSIKHVPSAFITYSIGLSAAIGSLFLVVGSVSGDILGRRKTLGIAAVLTLGVLVLYLPLISTLADSYIILAQILIQAPTAVGLAVVSATFSEYFGTTLRYSASGLAFQLGGLYYGIILAFVEPALFSALGIAASGIYVVGMIVVTTLVSLVCIAKLRETRGERMSV